MTVYIVSPVVAASSMCAGIRFDPVKGMVVGDPFQVTSFESPA